MDHVRLKCQWDDEAGTEIKNADKQANFLRAWQMTPLALQSSGTGVNKSKLLTLASFFFFFLDASAAQLSTGHSGG